MVGCELAWLGGGGAGVSGCEFRGVGVGVTVGARIRGVGVLGRGGGILGNHTIGGWGNNTEHDIIYIYILV